MQLVHNLVMEPGAVPVAVDPRRRHQLRDVLLSCWGPGLCVLLFIKALPPAIV